VTLSDFTPIPGVVTAVVAMRRGYVSVEQRSLSGPLSICHSQNDEWMREQRWNDTDKRKHEGLA
jgi:hypothetical protein